MDSTRRHVRDAIVCTGIAGLVFGVFLQAMGFDFVFDDGAYVTENTPIHGGLTWEGLRWAFTAVHTGFWYPMTMMSHMLDVSLYGLHPAGHHLTSILLHAASAVLCFLVLRSSTGAAWPSALAAALFAIHPQRAESVANVSERKDVLSVLFCFLTMAGWLRYLRRPSIGRYGAAAAAFALGLMAKPMLVTLPFALLLLDFWPLNRLRLSREAPRLLGRLLLEKAPFFLLAGAAAGLTFLVGERGLSAVEPFPLPVRLLNVLSSYGSYLWKTVWPYSLAAFYPHPGRTIPLSALLASAAALTVASLLVLRAVRAAPFLAVGWLWFLGTLVPVAGFIQMGDMGMADHFTYLPSVGLFVMLAWGLRAWAAGGGRRPAATKALSLSLVLFMTLLSFRQTRFWRDEITLFSHTLALTGSNSLVRYNLAVALQRAGRVGEAEGEYRRTLAEDPAYLPAYNGLSALLFDEGRPREAIDVLTSGISRSPGSYRLQFILGQRLLDLKRVDDAAARLEEAVRLRPGFADGHISLGIARAQQGRLDEAERHFSAALAAEPSSAPARENLRILAEMRGASAR